jgi:hypothetical protein
MQDRKSESGIPPAGSPLKRDEGLRELSRDHHDGLLLCWKIRQGIQRGIETRRVMSYINYIFRKSLQPHFQLEEQHVLSLLPAGDPMREKALLDHHELSSLAVSNDETAEMAALFEQKLSAHIRFEERVVFQEIQKIATNDQLHEIAQMHKGKHKDCWRDRFWE